MSIHLTAAMKKAAAAYARREGVELDEAARLAHLNLLTADGHRKHTGPATGTKARRKAERLTVTADERATLRARDPKAHGVTLARDADGYYVLTHRAQSKRYPTVEAIPVAEIHRIEGTG
jgi:hypothetical protein